MKPSEAIDVVKREIAPMYPQWAQLLVDANKNVKSMEQLSAPLNATLLNVQTTVVVK